MHDVIFCFERSDKKYYGELLSPATNFLLSFPNLPPNPLLIFSSYHLLCVLFFYQTIITVCKASISL